MIADHLEQQLCDVLNIAFSQSNNCRGIKTNAALLRELLDRL